MSNVYGSDPTFYDFEVHLRTSRAMGRPTPADSDSAEVLYWQAAFDAPSPEALHRHAQRFGPAMVKETVAVFGVDLRNVVAAPKTTGKRTRRTTETLKAKVLNLHERGVIPAAIADQLNVSDRRVKEILRAA